jgi:5'-3' exoribonuclease 2
LDFNGIIQKCSHADEDTPLVAKTEKEIIFAVFGHIERLFSIAKPQKVLFIAVDGIFYHYGIHF